MRLQRRWAAAASTVDFSCRYLAAADMRSVGPPPWLDPPQSLLKTTPAGVGFPLVGNWSFRPSCRCAPGLLENSSWH